MLKINEKEIVTVSDDCTLKFWNAFHLKVDFTVSTETITCICATGPKHELLVAGCHSGNFITIKTKERSKKETFVSAHQNLVRVLINLESLKSRYFCSADVCGFVKVWQSGIRPVEVFQIELPGAISYNSMVEVNNLLPTKGDYIDTSVIACALKTHQVNLILLCPTQVLKEKQYQIIKTFSTEMKPTCLIQLSQRHLAVAVGSLKENSNIEIHDIVSGKCVSTLKHHSDMIDSLLKLDLSSKAYKVKNPYVQWVLSASRDRRIVLWKLLDGKPLSKSDYPVVKLYEPMRSGGRDIASRQSRGQSQRKTKQGTGSAPKKNPTKVAAKTKPHVKKALITK